MLIPFQPQAWYVKRSSWFSLQYHWRWRADLKKQVFQVKCPPHGLKFAIANDGSVHCLLPGQICRSLRSSSLISVLLPSQTPVWYGWLPYYGVITTWYHWIVTDSAQIVMCFPFSRPGRSDFVGNRKKCEADHPDWWETDFNSWSDIVVTIVDLH